MIATLTHSGWLATLLVVGASFPCSAPRAQTELQKIVASDPAALDGFGHALAVDGATTVVGAPGDDDGGAESGSVYILAWDGTSWSQQAKLTASDAAPSDAFGTSVAISGGTVIVGAPGDEADLGAAYVFVESGGTWTEQAKLTPSVVGQGNGRFGAAVAVSRDMAIIGVPDFQDATTTGGDAYLWERSGAVWTELARFPGLGGQAVAIDLNGTEGTVAIAEPPNVWLARNFSGTWEVLDLIGGSAADEFGACIAIDRDTMVIGAPGSAGGSGHADVFEWCATCIYTPGGGPLTALVTGRWVRQDTLAPRDPGAGDRFGNSAAIDGDSIVLGADGDDTGGGADTGSAYLFARVRQAATPTWAEVGKWTASDASSGDHLGIAVEIAVDTAVLGAELGDTASVADSGAAYAFALGGKPPRDIVLADLDSDGDLDAVTANDSTSDVSLWTNDGFGGFAAPLSISLTAADIAPVALSAGDLDADGRGDDLALACASSHTVAMITDVGGGNPVTTSLAANGLRPVAIAVGDLDGVPPDDVAIAREGEPLSGGAGIAVSLNGAPFTDLSPTVAAGVLVCDLDGDGDNDIAAVTRSPDEIVLFEGDGAGTFTPRGGIGLPTGLANGLCCDDLDGDGDNDLVVTLPTLFPMPGSTLRIYAYADDGSGALDPPDYTIAADVPTGGTFGVDVACGELEDDGIAGFFTRKDVVVVHAGSADVEIYSGFDGAAFASTSSPTVGINPIAAAVGDLNGDGGDDVAVANQGSGDITVLLSPPPALGQAYGIGCAGTGGLVPDLASAAPPSAGAATVLQLSNARPFAPALLLFSGQLGNFNLPGGCPLFVGSPQQSVLRFTDGRGFDAFSFAVPATPSALGLDAYFQHVVFDPAGAFAGVLSLSNGLRIQVGT